MELFTYVDGPLWSEFKSANFSDPIIERHSQLLKELESFHEISQDHFEIEFSLPKVQ
jgi:hypothetical protein